ncbi:unnamed protein product [Fraxinus pennsylvanica]|uniref:Uncharacterized protein n=1 Tax=Fraxinus pennsylvanica TaxID=56036 RepID=A0AAD2EH41_9LAMI|nr:unnamed protein product [Fraxinus pennsylvanica]
MGENLDRVNIIALCRADLQPYQCREYVADATIEVLNRCPYQKQAVFWHEFCMVRYSNDTILGTVAILPYRAAISTNTVQDSGTFYRELNILLDSLRNQTVFNSSTQKFAAAASRPDPNFERIYAFEQCTPDITPEDCAACLYQSAQIIPQCCGGKRGARILRPSCYLRFETNPFYNDTMVRTLQLEPTQPILEPPATGKEDNDNTTRTVIIVVIPTVACLILALCIGIFLRMRRKHKPSGELETDNEISTELRDVILKPTIRTATDDFSDANKLGQGGFGVVYKGKLPNGNEIAVKRIVGTYGYMAPEYIFNGQFSIKSDVFSFGVLVLEIVTGQRINTYQNGDGEENLFNLAWRNWNHGTIENMMDPALRASGSLLDIVRCIHIGLLCVQENAAHRPTMGSIVLMFTSFSITLPAPSKPAFFGSSFTNPEILNSQECNSRASLHISQPTEGKPGYSAPSINDVSITELYPR